LVGGATAGTGTLPILASWSDGTPDIQNSGTQTAVTVSQVGGGFTLQAPADGTTRTLHLYVGVHTAQATLLAALSDGSAPSYSDGTLANRRGTTAAEYTFTYRAASAGQTLTITFSLAGSYGAGAILLEAATLVGGGGATSGTGGGSTN